MKRTLSHFLFLFIAVALFAQRATESALKPGRETLSLDKGWRFHLGDIPFPELKGHQMTYENAKAGQAWGAAAPGYDDSDWRIVTLPHDWAVEGGFNPNANVSQGYRERGFGWYRRAFKLAPEDRGKHLELQFDGISTYATVWVNGTILHRNFCGYTSMYIDITPYATYGDNINTIAVRVDANPMEGWWYEGAGMYRHTYLVKRSAAHVITDGVFANPVKEADNKWEIPVEVTLNNVSQDVANADVEASLYDAAGKLIVTGKQSAIVPVLCNSVCNIALNVDNPMLWDVEKPVLYTVKTIVKQNGVVVDALTTKCGFRTIRFDKDNGFFLNDKNIKIKGVCNHQDHAGVGVAIPDALWEFRIKKLKEMGVNGYRCAHNPPSKEFLDICDSLGMMVLDENRIFNTSPENARQLEWMVRRDRNRPCVILWSVFNEEPMQGTSNGYEMVRRMSAVVKQLDTTRPVTAAMNGGFFSLLNVANAVDLVGFNYQIRDYDKFHKEFPERAFTSSEDGSAFMTRGAYKTNKSKNILSSYDTEAAPWGATHRNAWKAVAERPYMAGCFYWTGFDYRGEPTPFQWPSAGSFFGIMDLCGFPKTAFYIHQAQWLATKPVINIAPHWNWPTDTIGKPIQVMVMSNADSVTLKLNGKLIGGQKVDKYEMNSWQVLYQPGRLEAFGYSQGKQVAKVEVKTVGEAVRLRLTPDRKSMSGNGVDAMPITVEVVDAKGNALPTAQCSVTFSISGPANIIGLGNGDSNSHEAEKGNQRSLFNGLAQVIIQTTEEQGEVVLTANATGLKSARLVIPVSAATLMPFVAIEYPPIILSKWFVSPISAMRPDLNQKINENDMNSWTPVVGGTVEKLKENGFVIERTTFKASKIQQTEGGNLILRGISGKAEVWLNGRLIGKKESLLPDDLKLTFPQVTENCELRVLLEGIAGSNIGLGGTSFVKGK